MTRRQRTTEATGGPREDFMHDALHTLERIEGIALRARKDLAHGSAVNGISALTKIEHEAADCLGRASETLGISRLETEDAA